MVIMVIYRLSKYDHPSIKWNPIIPTRMTRRMRYRGFHMAIFHLTRILNAKQYKMPVSVSKTLLLPLLINHHGFGDACENSLPFASCFLIIVKETKLSRNRIQKRG
jgi:hypothetical protein